MIGALQWTATIVHFDFNNTSMVSVVSTSNNYHGGSNAGGGSCVKEETESL
jgi:hypothetical protein